MVLLIVIAVAHNYYHTLLCYIISSFDRSLITVPNIDSPLILNPTNVTLLKNRYSEDCCGAKSAIDRDLTRGVHGEAVGGVVWIRFEFDRRQIFNKIVIYYRFYTNWYNHKSRCAESVEQFKACVDADNNADVSVFQGEVKQKSCGTLQLTYGLEQSDQIYTLICNTKGNTVLLSKTGDSLMISEILVTKSGRQ